jgi:hypothetical protein
MTNVNRSIVFVDGAGGSTISLTRALTSAATIQSEVLAVSNADWFNEWEGTLNINTSPSTVVAEYQSVRQRATLTFLCADGTSARVDIVAPKLAIFLADGVTVDSTMITSLITACVGTLLSATLSPATAFLSGVLNTRPDI